MMSIQLLFCVEADKRSKTDWVYIKSVIDKYYEINNSISIKPIYMGGKTNYRRSKIITEIKTAVKQFKRTGSTTVIYCIDTDDWDINPDRSREYEEIKEYCCEKGYDLVWFCKDVEDVFWENRIHSSDKTEAAQRFRSQNQIDCVTEKALLNSKLKIGCSNILLVLDNYLRRCK